MNKSIILISDNGRAKPGWEWETDANGIQRGAVRIYPVVEDPERPDKIIPDYSTVFDEVELLDHIGSQVLHGIEQLTKIDRADRSTPPEVLRELRERAFERFIYRGELFGTEQYARYMFPERMRELDHTLRPPVATVRRSDPSQRMARPYRENLTFADLALANR